MSRWNSRDVATVFQNEKSIRSMYKKRYQAFVVMMDSRYKSLASVDLNNPGKDKLSSAVGGCNQINKLGSLVLEDAAIYSVLKQCSDKEGHVNYSTLSSKIDGKEIDTKFVNTIKNGADTYDEDLKKLSKIRDAAELEAKKEMASKTAIEFSDVDLRTISNALGNDAASSAKTAMTKYKTWNKVSEEKKSSSFFSGKSEYETWTDVAKKTKDTVYDTVMKSKTNILTAPFKILFFALHELLNPNSFFQRNVCQKVSTEFRKLTTNKAAIEEYKKMGIDITGTEISESKETVYTKTVGTLQQEISKSGYPKASSLTPQKETQQQSEHQQKTEPQQTAQPQQTEPQQQKESWVREAEEEKKSDTPSRQSIIADGILKYNCLVYIMMRAFAGTYGSDSEFKMFSFEPFRILDEEEQQKAPEKSEPETEDRKKIREFLSSDTVKAMFKGEIPSDWSKVPIGTRNRLAMQMISMKHLPPAEVDAVLGTSLSKNESHMTLKKYVALLLNEDEQPQKTYRLALTTGISHWTSHDKMMEVLLQKNDNLKSEAAKDAKYSVFFAYVNMLETILTDYAEYISAVEKSDGFGEIRKCTIKLDQIKNLRLAQATNNLTSSLKALFSGISDDKFKEEINREMNPVDMFKNIQSIQDFLTINNMDFSEIKSWISSILPNLKRVMKPIDNVCTVDQKTLSAVFGSNGIPNAIIDSRTKREETKESDK